MNEEQKVGHDFEVAFKRATQLLLGYAAIVYSEEELNKMKSMFSLEDSQDIIVDETK